MNLIKSYIVYNVSGTVTNPVTLANIDTALQTATTAIPVDADTFSFHSFIDGVLRLVSWVNIKATFLLKANNLSDVANASTSRSNLGATTVGGNIFTLANPGAVRRLRINADNTVTAIDANEFIGIACSDETTVLAAASTSVPVATFHAPYAMTLTRVFAGLRTAGTGAAVVTVDIHVNGTTIMNTTKILFTAGVKLSADGTLTTTAIAAGDYVEIFLDQRDTDNVATGLKTYLVGYK